MNLESLTNAGLILLYQSTRLALEQDDASPDKRQFEVRENPEWRRWSDEIAMELSGRGVDFKHIEW
jgi:hypothetical protein